MKKEQWQKVDSLFTERYDQKKRDMWFPKMEPLNDDNSEILTISVPNLVVKNFVDIQFKKTLLEITNELGYTFSDINFIINNTVTHQKTVEIVQTHTIPIHSKINRQFTFDSFISGPGNEFAKSVTRAVAENPGKTKFNPLLIYSGVGLGKTHLLHAIGNYILQNDQNKKIQFITSEDFTNDFVDAIKNNESKIFSEKYKALDVLLIDDIQFLAGKERTQEEFFHIFNTLHNNNSQIVLTSDMPPNAIQGLHDRLVSRFNWGLCVDIQPPDLETRLAILRKKAEKDHLTISENILNYIAENISSNIRNLEGIILKIYAKASISNTDITIDMVKEIIGENSNKQLKKISIELIIEAVAEFYQIPVNNIREKIRSKEVAHCRQVAMYVAKLLTNHSLKSIGLNFGGRDHSTVIHAVKMIEENRKSDISLDRDIKDILSRIEI